MEYLIPVLFPFYFVGLWVTVVFLLARMGGWKKLSEEYAWRGEPIPKSWKKWQYARIGWVNYNGCLEFGATERGVVIRTFFLFKISHPPLFVPWEDITLTERKALFGKMFDMKFRRSPVKMYVWEKLAEFLKARGK